MSSTKKTNKKIEYGAIEAPDGFTDAKNHKVRITMWIDGDLLEKLKGQAAEVGAGYQTYAQKLLRDSVSKKNTLEKRVEKIEKALKIKAG